MDSIRKTGLLYLFVLMLASCSTQKKATATNTNQAEEILTEEGLQETKQEAQPIKNESNVSNIEEGEKSQAQMKKKAEDCLPIENYSSTLEGESYQDGYVAGARVTNQTLIVNVEYSGCQKGKSTLALINPDVGKKALTVQMDLKVKGAGLCEMLIKEEVCFDLSSIEIPAKEYILRINTATLIIQQP
jgi:hypothetical protein